MPLRPPWKPRESKSLTGANPRPREPAPKPRRLPPPEAMHGAEVTPHNGPNEYDPPTAEELARPPLFEPKAAKLETARAIVTNFKGPGPARDDEYLAMVRLEPCCACGRRAPSEAHHFGPRGMGEKCSDYFAVPLCTTCHTQWHTEGCIRCERLMMRVRDHALAEDPPHWLARLVTVAAFHEAQSFLIERWLVTHGSP